MSGTTGPGTKGFLFCDLRGYAAFVDRHGDRAAAELLETYRALVREVIAAHEGAEIRTEGDSFYVVFPAASSAVEAGLAIVVAAVEQGTSERPIRVGIGIHAGETIATTEGLVGGAVNIAARVCAKARSGEVLVTDTVRALTRTFLPYTYTGLGTQSLKGIGGGIPLYRVERTPATRGARIRRQLVARRGRVVAGLALAVVLVAVAGGFAIANRGPDCLSLPTSTTDVVAKIDPTRDCVVATYPVGRRPSFILAAGDAIWVANADDRTVTALAPDGRTLDVVGVGTNVTAIAADESSFWVLDGDSGRLTRLPLDLAGPPSFWWLPSNGELASSADLERAAALFRGETFASWYTSRVSYVGLVADRGRLWVSDKESGSVVSNRADEDGPWKMVPVDRAKSTIDTFLGTSTEPAPFTGPLAVVGARVWVGHLTKPDLAVVDADSGAVSHQDVAGATGGATGMAAIDDQLWVTYHGGQVVRVSSGGEGHPTAVRSLASTLSAVAGDAGAIWVASDDDHAVIRIDPTSLDEVARIDVGGKASGVAIGPDGSVWVTIR